MIITERKPRKVLYPYAGKAVYDEALSCDRIILPPRASTKTRLHEIAHCELGHTRIIRVWVSDYFQQEIEAHDWVYQRVGDGIPVDVLLGVGEWAIKTWHCQPCWVFNQLKDNLDRLGYTLDKTDVSYLWHGLKDYRKSLSEFLK